MKNESSGRRPVIGLVTLLVIFSVLCLTILSVLSYSTAKYERTLAQKNADSATAYYAADLWCTDAANHLYSVWRSGGDLSSAAKGYGGSFENGVISFTRAVDGARLLSVTIEAGKGFTVTSWNTAAQGEWTADDNLQVWDGN